MTSDDSPDDAVAGFTYHVCDYCSTVGQQCRADCLCGFCNPGPYRPLYFTHEPTGLIPYFFICLPMTHSQGWVAYARKESPR